MVQSVADAARWSLGTQAEWLPRGPGPSRVRRGLSPSSGRAWPVSGSVGRDREGLHTCAGVALGRGIHPGRSGLGARLRGGSWPPPVPPPEDQCGARPVLRALGFRPGRSCPCRWALWGARAWPSGPPQVRMISHLLLGTLWTGVRPKRRAQLHPALGSMLGAACRPFPSMGMGVCDRGFTAALGKSPRTSSCFALGSPGAPGSLVWGGG